MSTPEQTKSIAKRRLDEIEKSTQRILRKIEQNPSRKADYEKRLTEYQVSKAALSLELETGTPVKIKDEKQMALVAAMRKGAPVPPPSPGTKVDVPSGKLKLEGK